MPIIHFLNVKEGDCSIIQHDSKRVTVIDVCNATSTDSINLEMRLARLACAMKGDFQQKDFPVNPIEYMLDHNIEHIFRYIQTHPDMDHMDGIKALFKRFAPINFWDTDNQKAVSDSSWSQSQYNRDDWDFYKNLRDGGSKNKPNRLTLMAGNNDQYWNKGDDTTSGDGIYILAPTKKLVDTANDTGNYNDCSYVLLYRIGNKRIIFGGDSHNDTWQYILEHHKEDVTDIDLLIAPHHGRDSNRSYDFLDVLKPALTFFGNARSEHLAYNAWYRRGLPILTNNQANCMVVDASKVPMKLYVMNETYARSINRSTYHNECLKAWFVCYITRDLLR